MQTNNKLREALSAALEQVNKVYDILSRPCVFIEEARQCCREARGVLIPAIAEPVKNCEVGTAEEQEVRFDGFCMAHKEIKETGLKGCSDDCQFVKKGFCDLHWAQMPYEEGREV